MVLTTAEVDRELAGRRGWRRVGDALVRELVFRDFEQALRFVERVADAAVDYKRRPDMCISEFNHVRLSVANLKHAGFTLAEMRLAAKVNAIVDEHHPDAVSA
ncbi:MAG: 4a-hydroxytetrahydrobiopterin dehydratase [bacterium]|jgi:4a-hydroxytetrahydrobiopterin dehydratase